MGKPFLQEIGLLPATYAWALTADIALLTGAFARALGRPLVVAGSGGSLTAAEFACSLHQAHGSALARAYTPLDLASETGPPLNGTTTLILSAGGRNPDILAAARHVIAFEPRQIISIIGAGGSPLAALTQGCSADVFEYPPPSGKDGFLATNSLFGLMILLQRAYRGAIGAEAGLPETLDRLIEGEVEEQREQLERLCEPLWARETLVVLHGPGTRSAALDLESKFTEAALGSVQIADFRNYAHGRHHWLAKRGASSGVLALTSEDDSELAERTLALLPNDEVPVVRVRVPGRGTPAALGALVKVMHVVAAAGRARAIDPGRPGVPSFGRKLYNLRALKGPKRSPEDAAIERKAGLSVTQLAARKEIDQWRVAHRTFIDRLRSARFGAVVLDYDGTICDPTERWDGIRAEVAETINDLLASGLVLGIATGRGKSVRDDLLRHVKKGRERVWLGYYNGGCIRPLVDALGTHEIAEVQDPLTSVHDALARDAWLRGRVELTVNRFQITVSMTRPIPEWRLWETVEQIAARFGVAVVRSSHSVDVLAPGVTKRTLVQRVREEQRQAHDVLCIGDRGRWPGNDHELLTEQHSLSVDEVSSDPLTCWNLASPGVRGAAATLGYLRLLAFSKGTARLSIARPT